MPQNYPQQPKPIWYNGKHIDEILFCREFLSVHPMKCVRGRLFSVNGMIEDESEINSMILKKTITNVSRKGKKFDMVEKTT